MLNKPGWANRIAAGTMNALRCCAPVRSAWTTRLERASGSAETVELFFPGRLLAFALPKPACVIESEFATVAFARVGLALECGERYFDRPGRDSTGIEKRVFHVSGFDPTGRFRFRLLTLKNNIT